MRCCSGGSKQPESRRDVGVFRLGNVMDLAGPGISVCHGHDEVCVMSADAIRGRHDGWYPSLSTMMPLAPLPESEGS